MKKALRKISRKAAKAAKKAGEQGEEFVQDIRKAILIAAEEAEAAAKRTKIRLIRKKK